MEPADVEPFMESTGFGFEYLDDSRLLEGRAEKLLAGQLPADLPAGARELSQLLSALRAPSHPRETAGEAGALAAFAASKEKAFLKEKAQLKEKGSDIRRLPSHFGSKVTVATAAALVAFTGVAAAAVTGSLPAPLQAFAHSTFGAPGSAPAKTSDAVSAAGNPGPRTGTRTSTPATHGQRGVGPVPGGASTRGLCRALDNSTTAGSPQSPPWRNLAAAAAAAGESVTVFCADQPATGAGSGDGGKPQDAGQGGSHGSGKGDSQGSGRGGSQGSGQGDSQGSGRGGSHGSGKGGSPPGGQSSTQDSGQATSHGGGHGGNQSGSDGKR